MSNNQYRKPVLTSTEEFVTTQGIFKRITTLYHRVLHVNGSIILDDDSFLDDVLFVHALGTKFGQEIFKGYIDFKDEKVPFEINLDVTDEDGQNVEFYKLGSQARDYIFNSLLKDPKSCNFRANDYGRGHIYTLNDMTFDHSTEIKNYIGSEKFEQLKAEVTVLANTFDSYNYD